MQFKTIIVAATVLCWFAPGIASAQVNPEFAELTGYIEEVRAIQATDRKVLIRRNLDLTPEEDNNFWTPYREYTEDMARVNDLRIKVITDYAANVDNMTDDAAKDILKDYFKYKEDKAKVRKKHAKKFKKVIPEAKVLRFYQIDNKLDAIRNFTLAMQIPLVEPK